MRPLGTWNAARLLAFPAAEAAFLLIAMTHARSESGFAAAAVGLAAFFQGCSLHISFHENLHQSFIKGPRWRFLSDRLVTLLLGTSYAEYGITHWEHHRFTNTLEDATSTWRETPAGPKPRSFLTYALGWPRLSLPVVKSLGLKVRAGTVTKRQLFAFAGDVLVLALAHGTLALLAPAAWVCYLATIYLGWCGIAAVNYLQHPPRHYGEAQTVSIESAVFNAVFYNNGLHREHHKTPQIPHSHLQSALVPLSASANNSENSVSIA